MFSAATRFALRRATATTVIRTNIAQPMFVRNFAGSVSLYLYIYGFGNK